jgi:hypothetical protein
MCLIFLCLHLYSKYVSTFHKPIPYYLFILLIIVIEVTSIYGINDYDHKYD